MRITSAGIIRNEEKPRAGIISAQSLADSFFDDLYADGIDLSFEETIKELKAQGLSEEEIESHTECMESGPVWLIGDWEKDSNGLYSINTQGPNGWAATYNSDSGNLCVEWSTTTKTCHHTSPCYVMADGSGPCGDLDTPGDSVLAFSLPEELIKKGGAS